MERKLVDSDLYGFMIKKYGGEAVVRKQYEEESRMTVTVSMPSGLLLKVQAEARSRSVKVSDIVRLALEERLSKPVSDRKKPVALKKRKSHRKPNEKPTKEDVQQWDAVLVKFLRDHVGERFYFRQVFDATVDDSGLDEGRLGRRLRRLVEKGKIRRVGKRRWIKYYATR